MMPRRKSWFRGLAAPFGNSAKPSHGPPPGLLSSDCSPSLCQPPYGSMRNNNDKSLKCQCFTVTRPQRSHDCTPPIHTPAYATSPVAPTTPSLTTGLTSPTTALPTAGCSHQLAPLRHSHLPHNGPIPTLRIPEMSITRHRPTSTATRSRDGTRKTSQATKAQTSRKITPSRSLHAPDDGAPTVPTR